MSAVAQTAHHMKYRFLGNTGLLVSKFALGSFVTFNTQNDFEKTYAIMEHAYKNGINFFDNAESYADGESEQCMGKIINTGIERGLWAREDLVISTKIFFGAKMFSGGGGPNDSGLSRKHIVEGTKASLKRFGLDYVDLVFCHRQDPYTPMEEIVRAMNYVIEQGWAFYWGTSEWTAAEIMEACEVADRLGLIQPTFDQTRYNILDRSRVDYDFMNLFSKYKYGVTAFYALAGGVLTGKYSNGIPKGSRITIPAFTKMIENGLEEKTAKALQLAEVAKEVGCTLPQLAIAWSVSNENVSTVLLGASRIEQLDENLKAFVFADKITPEIRVKIDAIAQFTPEVPQVQAVVHDMRSKWL
ncbi:Voltage-gated potassium channel subunit beta-2 [Phytophthora pseudosyringae]|uniref:Voltage-gated potassium channel subunit beta-2 n=1 Tax=Phytophthora pseudosyringae TaxID=221518 RepID=A0A8T1WPC5_9STRA|nr:Voltage-gated potassium channel subunit beta-2 [Phytophthora pseudosyringae]